jgi:nucleoside-diphosphate-sugar epimerase
LEADRVKSVAIIGAGGFVGSSLIESLVLDGHEGVRAVVRSYRNMAGFCQFGSAVDVRRANAEDAGSLAVALEGAHTVVNLTTGPPKGIIRSTRAIFDACTRAKVKRFIHLSSAVVYGDVPTPVGDDDPPVSRHWMPYARAKAASEVWLRNRLSCHGLQVVVLRPGIVWGVRSPHTIDLAQSLAGKSAYLVDGGRGVFNGIYIDNLVSCIRACCDYPGRASGFYNVGDREAVTWRALFEALGPALDCDPARLPHVNGDRLPRSVGTAVDTIQSLPLMNELYHRLKRHIPDGLKASIRSRLEGSYRYERHAREYAERASVARELWHLQRVGHKLPVEKFARTFHFSTPISFDEGVRRTVTWLGALGLASQAVPLSRY